MRDFACANSSWSPSTDGSARRLEIFRAEFDHELAGSENVSLHGVDHRLAFCLGGVEAQFRIQREDLDMIGVGAPTVCGEARSSVPRLAVAAAAADTRVFASMDLA